MTNNYRLPKINRKDFVCPEDYAFLKHTLFATTDEPIIWLLANGYAESTDNFYKCIAEKLGLEYVDDLPVKINDSGSIANKVGTEVQSKYLFFAYREGSSLVIATPDPSRAEEMVENTLPFIIEKPKEVKVVICPLPVVREALSQSAYAASIKLAESLLKESKPYLSSFEIFKTLRSKRVFFALLGLLAVVLIFPYNSFVFLYVAINIVYFTLNPIRFFISLTGLFRSLPPLDPDAIKKVPNENLPLYTIFVPLKGETEVAGKLINHLKTMDYPREKLDIKIAIEVDDVETMNAVRKELNLTSNHTADSTIFDIIKVPVGAISTKPRSLDYAMQFARGTTCVIYDAEDRPDIHQLKAAYVAFLEQKLNTLCIQGKLNFYNSRQNIITRFFTMEYSFWFDTLLPGMQAWKMPISLGGTSNHFITEPLRRIGLWDPYNVTEDADLGWRISRLGYTTAMMTSYTMEEASSTFWQWVKQRTRWQKGFLMTLMVHARTPGKMFNELGPWGFVSSTIFFSTNVFLPIINPILWILFILYDLPILFGYPGIALIDIPQWLELVGFVNLVLGNGIYIFMHAAGAIKLKRYDLLLFAPFLPLYWLLLSIASYRAVWQVIRDPYKWEKTPHGLGK